MSRPLIGEIYFSHKTGHPVAILPCEFSGKTELTVILYDEYGRFYWRKNYHLNYGKNMLEIPISMLGPGRYSAWIDRNGETYLRGFTIESQAAEKKNILSRFKRLLSLAS